MITIFRDISGADYTEFLAECCRRYHLFSIVWRDQLNFDRMALDLKTELRRFQISRVHTDSWPGTQLIGHQADVITYSIKAAATGVLKRPGSIFSWLAPHYPEDLTFYGANGECTISTVAHEREARFYDDDWLSFLPASAKPVYEHST